MEPRPDWHTVFINFCKILAERSTCLKMKTACLIVEDTQIVAKGYNGTFEKSTECSEYWFEKYKNSGSYKTFSKWLMTDEFRDAHREWAVANEIHAEANALKWINKRDANKYVLYTLYSPCDACAKSIISYGIKCVYYLYEYKRGRDALNRLQENGIECVEIKLV